MDRSFLFLSPGSGAYISDKAELGGYLWSWIPHLEGVSEVFLEALERHYHSSPQNKCLSKASSWTFFLGGGGEMALKVYRFQVPDAQAMLLPHLLFCED